jgi:hypothetical protein
VRRTWRAATTALVSGAAVAAMLSFTPAQAATTRPATAVPPAPSSALSGTWVNTNHATRDIVDLVVGASARGISVDGFGACSPTACEWGRIAGIAFGPGVSAKTGTAFEAQWNFGFARTVLLATYSAPKKVPTLTVQEYTTFTDGSHRANYTSTERFTKGKAVKVTKAGTSAANYPLGDSVTPAATLPAVWVNTASTGSIRAVILTRALAGALQVHAYGFCSPVPCNWGSVAGIRFGSSISAVTGRDFLAPYKFSFARKLLEGNVNTAGTRLTVRTWTEFTDHSGRSNYLTTESFVPLR